MLLFSGCYFGKTLESSYYILEYIPNISEARETKGVYPYTLRMRDFSIAESYRRSQIVYRKSALQMQFYSYHLWAVDPERMVNDMLVKHLKSAHLFENITRSVESFAPDFYLDGDVQAIEEYDTEDQWYAHLAIEYKLENTKTNQIIWRKTFDLRKKVAQQEPIYLVREITALLETMNNKVVEELDIALDENYVKNLSSDSLKNKTLPAPTSKP